MINCIFEALSLQFLYETNNFSCWRQEIYEIRTHLVLVLMAIPYWCSPTGEMVKRKEFVSGIINMSRVDGAARYQWWVQKTSPTASGLRHARRTGSPSLINHWKLVNCLGNAHSWHRMRWWWIHNVLYMYHIQLDMSSVITLQYLI